ncbi:MAG TPA: amidohydrolase [Aliiroseovarius sp.]|nr:amidohydrolase [Aliiroseovarius sp.]
MNENPVWPLVETHAPRLKAMSDRVWSTPETCYGEHRSAAEHLAELAHHGFRVTEGLAGIPTAMQGEAGSGGPVIAFLGEYDALAGLSQAADVAEPAPLEDGGNGHGCGHNMLGSAAMLAAIAVKDWLAQTGAPGRVRYVGCPAEEGGAAKAFMVADGVFDDVDIAITWHPGAIAQVMRGSSLAAARLDFSFTGRASHAAASPHLGRSALDAVELMSVGVNYLREHMTDQARIHYAYLDAGGTAPNVVQAQAQVRYVVREPRVREMMKLIERVKKVAQGAALMTETEMQAELVTVSSELVPNTPLCDAMQANLEALGPPPFNDADRDYAARFQATFSPDDIARSWGMAGMTPQAGKVLADFLPPADLPVLDLPGSTDVGDVSWVVPTVQLWGANYAIGTPFHSWQMVAQGKGAPALKGMEHAAKVMAATGIDALSDPDLVARAKADLAARTGPEGYIRPLPADARPPIDEMA